MNESVLSDYRESLSKCMAELNESQVAHLGEVLWKMFQEERQVFICGNGGSAANAMHIANDFLYGVCPNGQAIKVEALSANSAVLTCLGNDIGFENIFAHQLQVKGSAQDLLIVLSGSGNSSNILAAIDTAKSKGMYTYAIVGFDGGRAKTLADYNIHFDIADMQVSEDMQLILGHILMRDLNNKIASLNDR